jgi:hypothetical protein
MALYHFLMSRGLSLPFCFPFLKMFSGLGMVVSPVISALKKQKQEDHKFKQWLHNENLSQKTKNSQIYIYFFLANLTCSHMYSQIFFS